MKIGLDFDGVIVDVDGVTDYWKKEVILELEPVSEKVVRVLNENRIDLVLTGRGDLLPVLEWMMKYVPGYKGEVASAEVFGESKGVYLLFRGVDVFVDDDDRWIEEIRSVCGDSVEVLKFDKRKWKCPVRMLEFFGYM